MATVTLKERGQVTIPAKIRKYMGWKIGEELIVFESKSRIVIMPKIKDPMEMAGFLGKISTGNTDELIMKYGEKRV